MNPEFVEYNITVAASLLDRFANANIPSRLIINTPPETIHPDFIADTDEVGRKILVTPPFCGRNGVLTRCECSRGSRCAIRCRSSVCSTTF